MVEKRYSVTLGLNKEFKEIIDHCKGDKHISVFDFLKQVNEQDKAFKELKKENKQLKKEDELFFGKVFDILLKYQDLFNREMADEVLEELGIELTRWFE